MKTLFYTVFLIFSFSIYSYSQTGKLDVAKESLKQNNIENNSITSSSSKGFNKEDDTNPFLSEFGLLLVRFSIGLAYQIGVESYLEKEGSMHKANFSKYPYKESYFGNYVYNDSTDNERIFRIDIASSFVIESKKLYGNNFNINLKFAKRIDLELGSLQLFEKVNGNTDNFSLYQIMINYHRIRTQKLDFWFGFGIMYVANDVKETGFSYGLGAEWFLIKPISALITYKGTTINSRPVNKTRILLKYYISNYNISAGYEHYTLGLSKVNSLSVGLGVTF